MSRAFASGVDMVRWQSGAGMPVHRVTPVPGIELRGAGQSDGRAREGCCDLSESSPRYRAVDVMHIPECRIRHHDDDDDVNR